MPQLFSFPKPPTVPGAQPLPSEPPNRPIGQDWLSDAVDVILGGIGLENPLSSSASRATQVGGMIGAAVPMFGMAKAATAARTVAPTLEAGRAIEAAAPAMEAAPKSITAYHGSPHDFDQFSLSKIGTGEGAQAYGHGLYFAENENIAKGYQKQLSGLLPSGWSDKYPESARGYIRGVVGDVASGKSTPEQAAKHVYNANSVMREYPQTQLASELASGAELTKGKMYNVNINADPEHFLDWDKPLSEQHPVVQQKLREALPWMNRADPERLQRATGNQIYASADLGTPADASEALKAAGIPGIKYRDAGSRMTGGVNKLGDNWFIKGSMTPYPTKEAAEVAAELSGGVTRNYVVFDDHIVDILKKYGIALPFVGAAAAAQEKQ